MFNSIRTPLARGLLKNVRGQQLKNGARFFSEEPKAVKLPMSLYGEHATYANALYRTASRGNKIDAVEKDLASFTGQIESTPVLKEYLTNPIISRTDKASDMNAISSKMGLDDITRGFLAVLAENGRLAELDTILEKFSQLLKAQKGIVEASVTTATAIGKKEKKALEKTVQSKYLDQGKSLSIKYQVDPTILGGLQLQVGDKFLDLSVQNQIKTLKTVISTN